MYDQRFFFFSGDILANSRKAMDSLPVVRTFAEYYIRRSPGAP